MNRRGWRTQMKIRLRMVDAVRPLISDEPRVEVWNLLTIHDGIELINQQRTHELALLFGQGVVVEAKIEADSTNALRMTRLYAETVGRYEAVALSTDEKSRLRLYEGGYECLRQERTGGYLFLWPSPRPELFGDLA